MLTFQWLIMACFQAVRWSHSPSQACDSPIALWLQWHWHLGVTQKSPRKLMIQIHVDANGKFNRRPGPGHGSLGPSPILSTKGDFATRLPRTRQKDLHHVGLLGLVGHVHDGDPGSDWRTWWHADITVLNGDNLEEWLRSWDRCHLRVDLTKRRAQGVDVHIQVNTSTLNLFSCTCDSVSHHLSLMFDPLFDELQGHNQQSLRMAFWARLPPSGWARGTPDWGPMHWAYLTPKHEWYNWIAWIAWIENPKMCASTLAHPKPRTPSKWNCWNGSFVRCLASKNGMDL